MERRAESRVQQMAAASGAEVSPSRSEDGVHPKMFNVLSCVAGGGGWLEAMLR